MYSISEEEAMVAKLERTLAVRSSKEKEETERKMYSIKVEAMAMAVAKLERTWKVHSSREKKETGLVKSELEKKKLVAWKNLMIQKEEEKMMIKLEKGEIVKLSELLFTPWRDYLIKSNSDETIKADHLVNKSIVLYFVSLNPMNDSEKLETAYLLNVYTDLLCKGVPFEVVFVPVWDPIACPDAYASYKRYKEMFSSMPWPAIPFYDPHCYQRLGNIYGTNICGNILHPPASVIISPAGEVIQPNATFFFSLFGAVGFPFTDDRLQFLHSNDLQAQEHPSLTRLLSAPDRDYVINSKGDKIPIADLENKVVALYLYEEGRRDNLTTALKNAYDLAPTDEFEVVLIYIYDSWDTIFRTNEESFNNTFANMPWLALPFKDANCKMVQRVFKYPVEYEGPLESADQEPDPSLAIFGPRGEFFEPHASDIVKNFGSLAYPFTREKAVECRVEKAKKMKLDMFWCPETIFTKFDGSSEVRLSELEGKRIIVFFDLYFYGGVGRHAWFTTKLVEWFLRDKGTPEEFEVIHIFYERKGSSTVADLPWLTHRPFDKDSEVEKCLRDVFASGSGLLAFDPDGTVIRATENPLLERDDIGFPFYIGTLEDEAWGDLILRFKW